MIIFDKSRFAYIKLSEGNDGFEDMCNFSQGIEERARIKEALSAVVSLMNNCNYDPEYAMNILGIKPDIREAVMEGIKSIKAAE